MKAVIYARYSSDNQRDESIEDQIRLCRRRIDEEGWSLIATYTDRGISGATKLRPGYQKLLEDARSEQFDIVVAESLDRLSRDQEDVAGLYKQLSYSEIGMILHVGLKGTMNALYLKDLAQKTRRGLEGRVRQGRSAGGAIYGYDVVKENDANGEPVRGGRSVNTAEAKIVQRIFVAFAAGKSPARIARGLNQDGVPGPGGRPWQGNTISGHSRRRSGILRNEVYVGRMVWNRQRFVKDPQSGKRIPRLNPQSEWIVQEVPELRIIDAGLWAPVAERLDDIGRSLRVQRLRKSRFWEKRRPGYLLTGLVKCGDCGRNYTAVGGDYIACSGARKMGICTNGKGLRRRVLEDFVLETLKDHLMHPALVKEFIAEFHAEANRIAAEGEQQANASRSRLAEVARRHDGLIDAIADGLRSPGLKAKLDQLESEKAELEQEVAEAPNPVPRLHPNLAEVYRRKVADLRTALEDHDLRQEALTILRSLIASVTVSPDEDGFEVVFEGEIVRMIGLPEGKTPGSDDRVAISVKRVAGACNRLYLLLFARGLPRVDR
jgi:DNA invertase Pin-like site-specific DNA recombinase